jgi:adenine-specific DNA-methyltransferase
MFFTVENARRIDAMRTMLETVAATTDLTHDEYQFILASIIISADAVSNVPAVYGCYLKNFKAKATKPIVLFPIHTITASASASASATFHADVTDPTFLSTTLPPVDIAYLDPPYNERQYSKNYFPLNIIAKTPASLNTEPPLKGKTGIPTDCFLSPFCRKGVASETAFDTLIRGLRAKWIFLSYNSESIVSKEKMLEILRRYGTVSVIEREYKRFKSFEYNEDKAIQEYLFCLEKKGVSTDPAATATATATASTTTLP